MARIPAGVYPADRKVAELLALFQDKLASRREYGIREVKWERIDDPRITAALQVLANSDSVDDVRSQAAEALAALSRPQPSGELREEYSVHG